MNIKKLRYYKDVQHFLKVTIERVCFGGWICSYNENKLFLPGSQLYKNIKDYEAHVGKSVNVMVQRFDRWKGVVISHQDYIN